MIFRFLLSKIMFQKFHLFLTVFEKLSRVFSHVVFLSLRLTLELPYLIVSFLQGIAGHLMLSGKIAHCDQFV